MTWTSYDVIEGNMNGLPKMILTLEDEFQRSAAAYEMETVRLKRARAEAQAVVAQTQKLLCDIEAAISLRNIYAQYKNCMQSSPPCAATDARWPALLDPNEQNGHPMNQRNYYHPPQNQQRITQNGAIAKPKRNKKRNWKRRPQNTINSTSIVCMFNGQSGGQRNTGASGMRAIDNKENGKVGLLQTALSPIRSLPALKSEPSDWSSLANSDGAAKVSIKREPSDLPPSAAIKMEPLF